MSKNSALLIVVMVFCFLTIGQTQPSSAWGVGVAIIDMQQLFEYGSSEATAYNTSIVIPIILSEGFRLEPEVGFFRGKNTQELTGDKIEGTATQYRFGVGIFPQSTLESSTLYYGARVGYLSLNLREDETLGGTTTTDERTASGFFVAPAVGGEYYFSNSFCVGAEAQVLYASLSTDIKDSSLDIKDSLISTRGLVFVRFFF
jgi:hypothetical protein